MESQSFLCTLQVAPTPHNLSNAGLLHPHLSATSGEPRGGTAPGPARGAEALGVVHLERQEVRVADRLVAAAGRRVHDLRYHQIAMVFSVKGLATERTTAPPAVWLASTTLWRPEGT